MNLETSIVKKTLEPDLTEKLLEGCSGISVVGVGEAVEAVGHSAAASSIAATLFQALLTKLIVDLTFLGITQNVVGFTDLLELIFGTFGLVLVGVVLEGQLPVSLL